MTKQFGKISRKTRAAADRLRADATTQEVLTAAGRRELKAVLLKGPSIGSWLYEDPSERGYRDSDLLIDPTEQQDWLSLLAELGFAPLTADAPLARPAHAHPWHRPSDGAVVDVHTSLPGVSIDPGQVWGIVQNHLDSMTVGTERVSVLDESFRVLLVALHAAQHMPASGQVIRDLTHALDRVALATWESAANLARQLDAVAAFESGMRMSPAGEQMLARLGSGQRTMESELRRQPLPLYVRNLALSLHWIGTKQGLRAKLGYVVKRVWPPRSWMEKRYPRAAQTLMGLAAAYVWRPCWILWKLVPGLIAYLRARRSIRGGAPVSKGDQS